MRSLKFRKKRRKRHPCPRPRCGPIDGCASRVTISFLSAKFHRSNSECTIFEKTSAGLAKQLCEAGVDHAGFERPLPVCELTRCRATCCHDGVILSGEEARILTELGGGDGIVQLEDGRKKSKTIQADPLTLAEDFPDHFPKTRCVFLDDQHRCLWQVRAVKEGRHPWFYKPTSCWLHPVLITRKNARPVLTVLSRQKDEAGFASHTPCGKFREDAAPARESLGMELKMLGEISGRDFYGELNAPPGFSSRANASNSG